LRTSPRRWRDVPCSRGGAPAERRRGRLVDCRLAVGVPEGCADRGATRSAVAVRNAIIIALNGSDPGRDGAVTVFVGCAPCAAHWSDEASVVCGSVRTNDPCVCAPASVKSRRTPKNALTLAGQGLILFPIKHTGA
jgi:hypothetical protein